MRVVKFRGKVDGHWWYSSPCYEHDMGEWEQFWALVDKETVGEFTGLFDKNGREIYEGDVVTHAGLKRTGPVVYREDAACFCLAEDTGTTALSYVLISETPWEVRGNIYQNPELLKKDGEV